MSTQPAPYATSPTFTRLLHGIALILEIVALILACLEAAHSGVFFGGYVPWMIAGFVAFLLPVALP